MDPKHWSNGMCGFCNQFLHEAWEKQTRHNVCHPDWRAIEYSARACKLCALFWRSISTSDRYRYRWNHQRSEPRRCDWTRVFLTSYSREQAVMDITLYYLMSSVEEGFEVVRCLSFCRIEGKQYMNVNVLPPNSDCEQVLSLVDGWIHTCLTEHKECNISPPATWKPTRLLDVHSSDDRTILREGHEIPCRPKYATLSHCWGAGDHLTLNEKTVTKLKAGLPVDELDPTFRDAVRIARRLGSDYLWIDSLCILQDSHDDWMQESSRMGDIYQFGFFNIAASGAHNAKEGCFLLRSLDKELLTRIQIGSDEYINGEVPSLGREFANTPLSLRAWVLQERFLAPRTIHWGLSEMVWDCNHHIVGEQFPRGNRRRFHIWPRPLYKIASSSTAFSPAKERTYKELVSVQGAWTDIVRNYSAAKLTFDTDKLVALTGIVDVFRKITQDRFFAGLWEGDMELQLLWTPTTDRVASERISQQIAPTWSWLSLRETPIVSRYWMGNNKDHLLLCQILEKGGRGEEHGNEFAISAAFIKLRCSLVLAACKYAPEDDRCWPNRLFWQPTPGKQMLGSSISVELDTTQPTGFRIVWCMPVYQNSLSLYGLLLESAERASSGVYHRVGIFSAYKREDIEMIWKSCNAFYASQKTSVQFDKIPRYQTLQKETDKLDTGEWIGSKNNMAEAEKDVRLSYRECDGVPQHIITLK